VARHTAVARCPGTGLITGNSVPPGERWSSGHEAADLQVRRVGKGRNFEVMT